MIKGKLLLVKFLITLQNKAMFKFFQIVNIRFAY